MNKHLLLSVLIVFVPIVMTGCPPVVPATPAEVSVAADTTIVALGGMVTLTATSTDNLDTQFDWVVDAPGVLTMTAKLMAGDTVVYTAAGSGCTVVTATGAHSGQTAFIKVTVEEAEPAGTSHAGLFTVYEGSKTCSGCHPGIAEDVHGSVHYQWDGDTPYLTNGESGGKLAGINGFCTSPSINFIGILTNLDGNKVSGGCAQCHVGLGAKPSPDPVSEQLDNIDCLMCHSPKWKRKVAQVEGGGFAFIPDEDAMDAPLLEVITDIVGTSNALCLKCHATAGGGENNKRGDIESAMAHATPDLDVHLASVASGGAGMTCVDCHVTERHRIAGRGVDLRTTDLDVSIDCTECHTEAPHESSRLNAHTGRVHCATCHIPTFARATSTEMYRDFSVPEIHEAKRLWEPTLYREQDVVPVYDFFDGTSYVYGLGETATFNPDSGAVVMAAPAGDRTSPGAKIYPFKLHGAKQPMSNDADVIIPLKMGIYFQTANVDMSITVGATQAGIPAESGYEYVETERYMGIFHEVVPAEQALRCSECHGDNSRLDFDALGYTVNETYRDLPLCAACHEDQSAAYGEDGFFYDVHNIHTRELPFDCSVCHSFGRAR